jgi:hypothetical protein
VENRPAAGITSVGGGWWPQGAAPASGGMGAGGGTTVSRLRDAKLEQLRVSAAAYNHAKSASASTIPEIANQ